MYNALQSLQAFEMGKGAREERERADAMKGIGNALAGGDWTKAASGAFGMGDISTGLQLQQYGKGLQDAEAESRRVNMIRYGMGLLQSPPEQREAMRGQIAQTLGSMGLQIDPQQAAQMDLSDNGIKSTLMALQDTDGLMKMFQSQMEPVEYQSVTGADGRPMTFDPRAGVYGDPSGPEKPLPLPKYATATTDNGVIAYNTADPTDRVRMGGAPAKGDAGPDAADEGTIRREYMSATRSFRDVQDAYQRIKSTDSNTAAGQMSLVFQYMKMLDPASTVREGEYANAQNTTGVPGQVINAYNRALEGKFLNPEQVAEFEAQAGKLYMGALDGYNNVRSVYESVVSGYPGMDTGRVLPDFAMADLRFTPPPQPQTQTAPSNLTPDEQAELERLRKELGGR